MIAQLRGVIPIAFKGSATLCSVAGLVELFIFYQVKRERASPPWAVRGLAALSGSLAAIMAWGWQRTSRAAMFSPCAILCGSLASAAASASWRLACLSPLASCWQLGHPSAGSLRAPRSRLRVSGLGFVGWLRGRAVRISTNARFGCMSPPRPPAPPTPAHGAAVAFPCGGRALIPFRAARLCRASGAAFSRRPSGGRGLRRLPPAFPPRAGTRGRAEARHVRHHHKVSRFRGWGCPSSAGL
jgi:hypothetical protein